MRRDVFQAVADPTTVCQPSTVNHQP